MLNDAVKLLREKTKDHIDARDTERATLVSWPDNPSIKVDGDPFPYSGDKLVFAEYLQAREVEADFAVSEYVEGQDGEAKGSVDGVITNGTVYKTGAEYKQTPRSVLRGKLKIVSPLKPGDRLIVSRMTGQRYYVLGKDVAGGG